MAENRPQELSPGFWRRLFGFFGKKSRSSAKAVSDSMAGVAAGMLNTAKFLADSEYRRDVGYPWLRHVLRENWQKVQQEIGESQEMLMALWKYSQGKPVTEQEKKAAEEQLVDLIRVIPALAIFALPGGLILLPILALALPWDLMPSAFRRKVAEQYGDDALSGELEPKG